MNSSLYPVLTENKLKAINLDEEQENLKDLKYEPTYPKLLAFEVF